jgi:conjugal transfer pilus assembly protein TrbC
MRYSEPQSCTRKRAGLCQTLRYTCMFLALALLPSTGHTQGPAPEVSPHLYVFVSSSLNTSELVALARDSASLDAPMLLRGLVGSSLQETLFTLTDVVAQGAALELDPLLFESYGVEAVPAVVLTCGGRGDGPFALVYGLSPSQALPILRKALPTC